MRLDPRRPERTKGAGSDVKREVVQLDSEPREASDQLRGEVEAGGRSGDGAFVARVDGLVALAVIRLGGVMARDVRG